MTLVPDPQPFQLFQTWRGRDEWIKYLGGLVTGGSIKYFKLGEGGWRPSPEYSEQIGTGIGSITVLCTFSAVPILNESVTITCLGKTLIDDGNGNLTGDGTGTINYKAGTAVATFTISIPGGTAVNATYKTRGRISRNLVQDIGEGDGGTKNYSDTLVAIPVRESSVTVSDEDAQVLVDDGAGSLVPAAGTPGGSGTINYATGAISVSFLNNVPNGNPVRVTFKYEGEPQAPDPGKEDLESEDYSYLYTFTKDFSPGDIVFQGVGTGRSRVTITVGTSEANDDGTGNAPFFFEGGIFDDNDVMVCYFTFPGFKKTGSVSFSHVIDLVV